LGSGISGSLELASWFWAWLASFSLESKKTVCSFYS